MIIHQTTRYTTAFYGCANGTGLYMVQARGTGRIVATFNVEVVS